MPLTTDEQDTLVLAAYQRAAAAGQHCGRPVLARRLREAGHPISVQQVERTLVRLRVAGRIPERAPFDNRPPVYTVAPRSTTDAGFSVPPIPSPLPGIEELLARRKVEYARKDAHEEATRLIPVQVHLDGPVGIVHMGDPHVDDAGSDIAAIERDIQIINNTPGLFGANVGDNNNNWVGRLAQLFGNQETTAAEAWMLVEWVVKSTPWLYLLAGNHGVWSGAGDPLHWMISHAGVFAEWGARLELNFPNGKRVRINARHDFRGTSMWNPAHGPMKAIQSGWRDHILTCGHLHTSAHGVLKDPSTGLISHALRVAGYKRHDSYAHQLGLPNGNVSPSFTTIIDPRYADDDPRLIQTIFDTETAAGYLTFLRGRK